MRRSHSGRYLVYHFSQLTRAYFFNIIIMSLNDLAHGSWINWICGEHTLCVLLRFRSVVFHMNLCEISMYAIVVLESATDSDLEYMLLQFDKGYIFFLKKKYVLIRALTMCVSTQRVR